MKIFSRIILLFSAALQLLACNSQNAPTPKPYYTFSWPISASKEFVPRGGVSRGAPVEFDEEPSAEWKSLQDVEIPKRERDRLAILAMTGIYKVTFDFIETVTFKRDAKPDRPYQSWATEFVFVLQNTPNFISLQHIMVMYFQTKESGIVGPAVMKHWRQDWTYEDTTIFKYEGEKTWTKRSISRAERSGRWSQAVFQVDDSPRYEVMGSWQHKDGRSQWISDLHLRPLPRREFSVRSDYDALEGRHRISITPNGWTHEQDNAKLVLRGNRKYIAQEIGLNRYLRLKNFDYSAGKQEWAKTKNYWASVRKHWDKLMKERSKIKLRDKVSERTLWELHFEYAAKLENQSLSQQNKHAQETINSFLH